MADPYERNPLLDAIARGESGGDYNMVYAHGKYGSPSQPLTSMTVDQAIALADQIRRNPANKANAGPVGKYQFVGSTLRGLADKAGLTGNELFTPQLQDSLAWRNIQATGGDPSKLRAQWTSFGVPGAGRSDADLRDLYKQGMAMHANYVPGTTLTSTAAAPSAPAQGSAAPPAPAPAPTTTPQSAFDAVQAAFAPKQQDQQQAPQASAAAPPNLNDSVSAPALANPQMLAMLIAKKRADMGFSPIDMGVG